MPTLEELKNRDPDLKLIAKELAQTVCRKINEQAQSCKSKNPYKAQGILEYLIDELQWRV